MRIYPLNNNILVNDTKENNNIETSPMNDSNEDVCSICLDPLFTDNKFLKCTHLFHPECIINWMQVQKKNNFNLSCPICKSKYNYNVFVNKIIDYNIYEIKKLINKLQFLIDHYSSSLITYLYIKKIQFQYKCNIKCLETGSSVEREQLINYKINPLPDNLIDLISDIDKRYINNKDDSHGLLPKKKSKYWYCNIMRIFRKR